MERRLTDDLTTAVVGTARSATGAPLCLTSRLMTESRRTPGVGLISVGWMGRLHTKAYQAVPLTYPELRRRAAS